MATLGEATLTEAGRADALAEKIKTRTAHVGIVGLGYVGLPLAVEMARAGFTVTGIDVDAGKVSSLSEGRSYVEDVDQSLLASLVETKKLRGTIDFSAIAELDTINICVPTPLRKSKDPDMSYVVAAAEHVGQYVHPGMLVILFFFNDTATTE